MNWLWDFDQNGYRAIHVDFHRDWLDPLMVLITWTGLGWIQAAMLAIAAVWRPARPYAIAAFAAGAASGILRLGLVATVGRMRPSNFVFSNPLEPIYGSTSFPSGHTTTSFGIAFMLGFLLRGTERAWIAWAAFFWACLIGFSRIYVGVHYPTDVLGGVAMGAFAASLCFLVMRLKGWGPGREEPEAIGNMPGQWTTRTPS